MSVPMALVDYLPDILFLIAAVTLQRGLYYRMSKGAFAVFSAGTIMIFCAGLFKATWKLLLSLGICDFERLSQCFFPMQSVGFLLAGAGIVAMVFFKQDGGEKMYAAAAPVFSGTFIFVGAMVLGALGMCGGLAVESKRRNKTRSMIFFLLTFIFMLMMGYLSSKDFEKASMNWIAEGVNVIAWGLFLAASKDLVKEG